MPELLRSSGELEGFREEWEELWRADENATPFQHPAWLLPWWTQFGGEPRAVVARRGGRPLALLAFYIHTEPDGGERRLLMIGASTTDYLDGVFAPECRVEDVSAAVDALREEGGWERMDTAQLRPGSLLARSLERAGARRLAGKRCWRMPAVGIAELPGKLRRNVMYYRNRAERTGRLEFQIADGSNWSELFDKLKRQHTDRWRERGQPGVLADARVTAWQREVIPKLQAAGLLRLSCLRLNGEVLGVAYAMADPAERQQRTLYVYLHSYALEHAEFSPGTLLLAFAMERAAKESIEAIDLLRGDEEYKKIWRAEPVSTLGFSLAAAERNRMAA